MHKFPYLACTNFIKCWLLAFFHSNHIHMHSCMHADTPSSPPHTHAPTYTCTHTRTMLSALAAAWSLNSLLPHSPVMNPNTHTRLHSGNNNVSRSVTPSQRRTSNMSNKRKNIFEQVQQKRSALPLSFLMDHNFCLVPPMNVMLEKIINRPTILDCFGWVNVHIFHFPIMSKF